MAFDGKITRFEAVRALVGDPLHEVNGVIQYLGGQSAPSESDITVKQSELQAAYDAKGYARNRQFEYPPIGDQLDDLFHSGSFSSDMSAKLQAVKDKYPKV